MINLRQLTFTILLLCTLGCSKTDVPNTEEVKTEIAKTDDELTILDNLKIKNPLHTAKQGIHC